MPAIDLSILNQRQTPAFYADTLANRPSAGFIGRIFVSTNTFEFYRDNGTTWDLIGGPGTSTVTGTGANGQVTYWNGTSSITGSNNLFFDAVNGHLGIGTITPGTALDVKHDQSTVVQLEQETATNDTRIAFINSGVGLWRLGAFYNAGANDFGLFDIAAAAQPVTVKRTTGQVLIGTSTVGTGKLTVASATGDNHIQIVGATSPSLRIDSAESGPTKRIGLGLATAVNNFIQNSQNLDMCIFNGSTSAAGNMLFGIYDTGLANIQEAARISSARNFLIGTITDTGQKLQVSGTAYISGNTGIGTTPSVLLHLAKASAANQLWLQSTTGTNPAYMNFINSGGNNFIGVDNSTGTGLFATGGAAYGFAMLTESAYPLLFGTNNTERMRITSGGNLLIGTTTDTGQKLQVSGTALITGAATFNNNVTAKGDLFIWGGNAAQSGQITANSAGGGLYIAANGTNQNIRLVPTGTGFVQVTSQLDVLSSISIANTVTAAVAAPSTHKVSILIGGVQYYLLASNV